MTLGANQFTPALKSVLAVWFWSAPFQFN